MQPPVHIGATTCTYRCVHILRVPRQTREQVRRGKRVGSTSMHFSPDHQDNDHDGGDHDHGDNVDLGQDHGGVLDGRVCLYYIYPPKYKD